MSVLFIILSMCSLSFFIKNLSGPFNIFGFIRNKILKNKYFGVHFYELLSCPWCIGFHSGYIIYLLLCIKFNFITFIMFGLTGSCVTALCFQIMYRITRE
jgi:hypothetical protein